MVDQMSEEEASPVCSTAIDKLRKSAEKLQQLLTSGELEAELRRYTLTNPVRHGNRVLSSNEAFVLERLARQPRPQPLRCVMPKYVGTLPGLEHAGFLVVRDGMVGLTPRGRAFGIARKRQHDDTKLEANRWRDWVDDLSRRLG